MLRTRCKRMKFLLPSCRIVADSNTQLRLFHKEHAFLRFYSSKSLLLLENDEAQQKDYSFSVQYLIKSCGLSPEMALSASKKVHFDNRKGPDSVLCLLKIYGLSDTDISELVKRHPELLLVNSEKNLLPKLEFFSSIGISGNGLARVLCCNPNVILRQSLERSIIPRYDILKSLLLFDDDMVASFFRSTQRIVNQKVLSNIAPNISVLRGLKVPDTSISLWVGHLPYTLSLETEKFKENVKKAMSMGFSPLSATFMKAVHVMSLMDASKWEKKMECYRSCGWSEDDILLAYRKNPFFMSLSEKLFSAKMNFLVNKMGWKPADVAGNPTVLTYSLEKWIIPRCSVIRILLLNDLIIKAEIFLTTVMVAPKAYFLDRFVIKYQEQLPQLLSVFQGKIGLAELGLDFEQKEV